MNGGIVTMRMGAREYKSEEILITGGEEGFALTSDGELLSLPSGCHRLTAGDRAIVLRRAAACECVAGAGEASGPHGWFGFRCELICARRFVSRFRENLLEGVAAEDLLTRMARQCLAEALVCDGQSRVWTSCRCRLERALLDNGWRLTGFRPGRLDRGEEVSA